LQWRESRADHALLGNNPLPLLFFFPKLTQYQKFGGNSGINWLLRPLGRSGAEGLEGGAEGESIEGLGQG
jgi:hypothetical protein